MTRRGPHIAALLGLALLLPACAAPAAGTVRVFRSAGAVQCADPGLPLPMLARQLEGGGVKVQHSACGSDGRLYAARCGGPNGRIGIFEIAAADAPAAEKLGFRPLAALPDALETPCP